MTSEWLSPPPVQALSGDEPFIGCSAVVLDFWRYAMSDLRMNNVRGYLAEFLVARAVGAFGRRVEWDSFDVLTPDGVRVEVKAAAYLQAWDQRGPSRIVFSGLRRRAWTAEAGQAREASYNADVYVFAVQTSKHHEEYDPLDVSQWKFFVVARHDLARLGYSSIGLAAVESLAGTPARYDELAIAVAGASHPRD